MNKKQALKKSINNYRETALLLEENVGEKIALREVNGKHIKSGVCDCPLCQLYIDCECLGCPIYEDTNRCFCCETPYPKYERLVRVRKTVTKTLVQAAKNELEYLEGLYKRLYDK